MKRELPDRERAPISTGTSFLVGSLVAALALAVADLLAAGPTIATEHRRRAGLRRDAVGADRPVVALRLLSARDHETGGSHEVPAP